MKREWKRQLYFNKKFYRISQSKDFEDLTTKERMIESKNYTLHLICEVLDSLKNIPDWKTHRREGQLFVQKNILEDLIDTQKFLFCLMQIWGITYEDVVREFGRKSDVVEQRFFQEYELSQIFGKNDNIVAVDIDGVLSDTIKGNLKFFQNKLCADYKSVEEVKRCVDPVIWTKLRAEKYNSGELLNYPIMPGAKEFLQTLKEIGYIIILISARPYNVFSRIYSDTIEWLRKNGLVYDALFFDELKHVRIFEYIKKIKFMVEDNPKYAEDIARMGYKVYLLNGPLIDAYKCLIDAKVILVGELLDIFELEKIG